MELQNQSNGTALSKNPNKKDIESWLTGEKFKEALKVSLPSHLTPDRFVRAALTAMMRTPKLAECTKESFFKAMLDLSSLGLEPDGRRAHLIPYKNNKDKDHPIMEVQLVIDYKGLIELAKRSGEIISIRAELVCENDFFSWENGIVTHRIDFLKPRGETLAVYSHVKNASGVDEYEVMTLEQVGAIRKRSKAANFGPWVTDFDEMAKKSVIRRHSKKLTLSPEFNDALEKDHDKIDDSPSVDFPLEDLMPKRISESFPVNEESKQEPKKEGPTPQKQDAPISPEEAKEIKFMTQICQIDPAYFDSMLSGLGCKNGVILKSQFPEVMKWLKAMQPAS